MESSFVSDYCTALLKFAKNTMPAKERILIEPFEQMAESRQTVADQILDKARKLGFEEGQALSQEAAQQIAAEYSEKLAEDAKKAADAVNKHQDV